MDFQIEHLIQFNHSLYILRWNGTITSSSCHKHQGTQYTLRSNRTSTAIIGTFGTVNFGFFRFEAHIDLGAHKVMNRIGIDGTLMLCCRNWRPLVHEKQIENGILVINQKLSDEFCQNQYITRVDRSPLGNHKMWRQTRVSTNCNIAILLLHESMVNRVGQSGSYSQSLSPWWREAVGGEVLYRKIMSGVTSQSSSRCRRMYRNIYIQW